MIIFIHQYQNNIVFVSFCFLLLSADAFVEIIYELVADK